LLLTIKKGVYFSTPMPLKKFDLTHIRNCDLLMNVIISTSA
jgi:hypothetical protein